MFALYEVAVTINDAAGRLSNRREVSLIVRVVLDADNTVLHGEVVQPAINRSDRFTGWPGLVQTVRDCLGQRAPEAGPPPTGQF